MRQGLNNLLFAILFYKVQISINLIFPFPLLFLRTGTILSPVKEITQIQNDKSG